MKCPIMRYGFTCSTCVQKKLCDKERKEYAKLCVSSQKRVRENKSKVEP